MWFRGRRGFGIKGGLCFMLSLEDGLAAYQLVGRVKAYQGKDG